MTILHLAKLPGKFPFLGIKLVHYWNFGVLQKIFSLGGAAKNFVEEIIYFSKQQLSDMGILLKMNYKNNNSTPFFDDHSAVLFISKINNGNEKYNRIRGNNYCSIKGLLFDIKYNL